MAEELTIDGQLYKRRGPVAVWLLGFVTLGIYGLVWYYKINDEARRYLKDDSIRPGMSVLAFIPGFILIVPPFVSIYRTGQRIQRMEERAGVTQQVEPLIGLLLGFLWSTYVIYYQIHLNGVWDAALRAGAAPAAPAAVSEPGPVAIPPPPSSSTMPNPSPGEG